MKSDCKETFDSTEVNNDRKLGELLLGEKLITESQLHEAIKIQTWLDAYKPIGQIFIDLKIITKNQLNFLLDRFKKRPLLGEILVRSGAITNELLETALEHQKKNNLKLGDTLLLLNFINEEVMRQALCTQLNIPFVNIENIVIDRSLSKFVNKNYAQKHQIVPIAKIGETLTLVMDDPTNSELVQELESYSGLTINFVTSTRAGIKQAFKKLYEESGSYWESEIDSRIEMIDEDYATEEKSKYVDSQKIRNADTIVQKIISLGVSRSATDIHLETMDRHLQCRFRIDGILQDLQLCSIQEEIDTLRKEIISRIKILGKMDIAEKRRPQDGSFRTKLLKDGQELLIDFRISIVPGYYGENVVLRILDPRKAPQSIHQIGFSQKITSSLYQILQRNTGIILITGPTGSGKSTTLYGSLMTLYQPGIKILTAENPIEYVYDEITQCEVNDRINNTFANYIRAFLRQDPEIIMVGEIRDPETAEMAFRAAQTGHLVLSTLHSNDAVSTVTRLLGLGVDQNLLSSCLIGILSQRLVRKVCQNCKKAYTPPDELIREFFPNKPPNIVWYKGQRCEECNFTGYKGRMAVAELWVPNDEDILIINKGCAFEELKKSALDNTILMTEDAMSRILEGQTNLEELMRTLPYSSIYYYRYRTAEKVDCTV